MIIEAKFLQNASLSNSRCTSLTPIIPSQTGRAQVDRGVNTVSSAKRVVLNFRMVTLYVLDLIHLLC